MVAEILEGEGRVVRVERREGGTTITLALCFDLEIKVFVLYDGAVASAVAAPVAQATTEGMMYGEAMSMFCFLSWPEFGLQSMSLSCRLTCGHQEYGFESWLTLQKLTMATTRTIRSFRWMVPSPVAMASLPKPSAVAQASTMPLSATAL
jgi:hypothetical protein